jgi:hypothetical protein
MRNQRERDNRRAMTASSRAARRPCAWLTWLTARGELAIHRRATELLKEQTEAV